MTTPPDPRRLIAAPPRDPRGRPLRFVATTPDGLVDVLGEMVRTDRDHVYRTAKPHAKKIIAATSTDYSLTDKERRDWLKASTHSLVDTGQAAQGPPAKLILEMMRQPRRTRAMILGAIVAHVAEVLRECNSRRASQKLLRSSRTATILLDRHAGPHKGPSGVWRGR